MQRLLPGLVAHAILAAINVGHRSTPVLDLEAYRARLPLTRLSIADKARRSAAERAAYARRCAARRPETAGDHRRLEAAAAKRRLRAGRRDREAISGGWGVEAIPVSFSNAGAFA